MDSVERWAWYLNIAAEIALVLRISLAGLVRMYRLFYIYLLVDILQQTLRLLLRSSDRIDAEIYIGGQAVKMVLAVFVVLELYWLALAGRPALARFGRKTVAIALAAAALIAGSGLALDSTVPQGRWLSGSVSGRVLYRFLSFERTMDAWLLIFLLLIMLFMTWFPVRLKRNLALYIGGFVVFFMANAAVRLLVNLLAVRFLVVR